MQLIKNEFKDGLCVAIEALEDLLRKHFDWRYVRNETDGLIKRLEGVLCEFESLVKEMDEELAHEATGPDPELLKDWRDEDEYTRTVSRVRNPVIKRQVAKIPGPTTL